MLRALDDPEGSHRVAIVLSDDAYDVLNRARIAAGVSGGAPPQRMCDFIGQIVEAVAQGFDPVEIEQRIAQGASLAALTREDAGA